MPETTREELPLVTIVIAAYRSLPFIERCLKSIQAQTYPSIEIIVVDALSYPAEEQVQCKAIIEKYGTYLQDGPERSIQRNRGIQEALGEYVAIIDQDMSLSPEVIEQCYQKMITEDVVGIIIPEISVGKGFWAQCVALERYVSTYLEDALNESCRFVRTKDALAIGGYDPAIVGAEDSDFHYRIKELGAIAKIKAHIVADEGEVKFWDRIQKKYYYSVAFREYVKRRPVIAGAQFFPIKLAYFKHPIVLLKTPLVTLGMFVLRAAEVMAGAAGILFNRK